MRSRITMQEYEEFEKQFLFQVLANPDYRLGQAFSNTFRDIVQLMEGDGDLGQRDAQRLWETKTREEVLKLIDWYIEK